MNLSVVVPVFNSFDTLPELTARLTQVLSADSEVILVDDGSDLRTWSVIKALATPQIRGVRLTRNFGQHAALLAGVREARHSVIATLDDDLQNPPEELARLLNALTDNVDVVYGVPRTIKQPIWRSIASVIARKSMQKTLGFSNAVDVSSFRVFRSQLQASFNNEIGPRVSLDVLLSWSTSRFESVEVDHHTRKAGKSNYSFWQLLQSFLDIVTSYSTAPLRLATGLGLTTVLLSVGVIIWVLGLPLITGRSVPGFPFLASTIAIFSGTQLLVLGVIGQYVGRIHFRVMNKPTYTIAERTDETSWPH